MHALVPWRWLDTDDEGGIGLVGRGWSSGGGGLSEASREKGEEMIGV